VKRRFAPRYEGPLRGRGCGFAAEQGEGEARLRRGGMRVEAALRAEGAASPRNRVRVRRGCAAEG
jgi:hypothetical protein